VAAHNTAVPTARIAKRGSAASSFCWYPHRPLNSDQTQRGRLGMRIARTPIYQLSCAVLQQRVDGTGTFPGPCCFGANPPEHPRKWLVLCQSY